MYRVNGRELSAGGVKRMTVENLMAIDKSYLQQAANALNKDDIAQLVEWLSLKDDIVRYQAFLLLQSRSSFADDVY